MAGMSVDGLISGLDTTALITQLMQLEKQPQVRLQTKKAAAQRAVTAYQDLNTRFSSLRDAGRALAMTGEDAIDRVITAQ